ncbi:MAG: ATP-binding protein [Candidatus Schekmanbacteria bacterium]|nr:ATP-binding protein [Candidatus Schekmanbacteria bacterium]
MTAAGPNTPSTFELSVPSATDYLELIRGFVARICEKFGIPSAPGAHIVAAVDEAAASVIEHAHRGQPGGEVRLAVAIDYQKLSIVVTDDGAGHAPEAMSGPDPCQHLAELRVGGLGVYLMKTVMDEVEWTRDGARNQVKMVKHLIPKGEGR